MDEAHVVEKHIHKKKVLGCVNQRIWIGDKTLAAKSFTIMLLISVVAGKEKFFHFNMDNNSGTNVLTFIADAIRQEYLVDGDYLILDNAPVHSEFDSLEAAERLCADHHIRIRFLPKYSPELNPCELCFNIIKSYLRNERDLSNPVWLETCLGIRRITLEKNISFYKKCLLDVLNL